MYDTTMTGSFYRTKEIEDFLNISRTGEVGEGHETEIQDAEILAISDQLHLLGSKTGLSWVSNLEQRQSEYTTYIHNRFSGFSSKNKISQQFSDAFYEELMEDNLFMANSIQNARAFVLPVIGEWAVYNREKYAKKEADGAQVISEELCFRRIFIPVLSSGVITVFYAPGKPNHNHEDFLFRLSRELQKEYRAILSIDGVDLQNDFPDLTMAKGFAIDWTENIQEVLPQHVQAINGVIKGLPADRIRVHYCYVWIIQAFYLNY